MSRLYDRKHLAVPPEAQYRPSPHDNGLIGNKRTIRFPPTAGVGQEFSPSDRIEFRLRTTGSKAIDPKSMRLCYMVKAIKANGTAYDLAGLGNTKTYIENKTALLAADKTASIGNRAQSMTALQHDDHGSCFFRTVEIGLGGSTQVERIDRYNRVRGGLARYNIDTSYKRGHGLHEGYNPICPYDQSADSSANDLFVGTGRPLATASPAQVTAQADSNGKYPAAALYTAAKNTLQMITTGIQHSVPLDLSGMLTQNRYLPLFALGSLDIDITLEDAGLVMYGNRFSADPVNNQLATQTESLKYNPATGKLDAGLTHGGDAYMSPDSSYVISDVWLAADVVDFSRSYLDGMNSALQTGGLTFDTTNFLTLNSSMTSIDGSQFNILFRKKFSSLKSIYVMFLPAHIKNCPPVADKTSMLYYPKVATYNILLDGVPVSSHVISTKPGQTAEAYHELLKSFDLHGENLLGTNASQAQYLQDAFMIGADLEKSSLMSGRDVEQILIELTLGEPNPINWVNANQHPPDPPAVPNIDVITVFHFDQRVVVQNGAKFLITV